MQFETGFLQLIFGIISITAVSCYSDTDTHETVENQISVRQYLYLFKVFQEQNGLSIGKCIENQMFNHSNYNDNAEFCDITHADSFIKMVKAGYQMRFINSAISFNVQTNSIDVAAILNSANLPQTQIKFKSNDISNPKQYGNLVKNLKQLKQVNNLAVKFILYPSQSYEKVDAFDLKQLVQLDIELFIFQRTESRDLLLLLANGLKSMTQLRRLKISNNQKNFYPELLLNAITGLNNLNHLEIDISGSEVTQKAGKMLASSLKQIKQITQVDINLFDTQLTGEQVKDLSNSLISMGQLSWLKLNLGQNQIGDAGLAHLASLAQLNLHHLDLNIINNDIGDEGIKQLANLLKKMRLLRHLTLSVRPTSRNSINPNIRISSDSVKVLFDSISELNQLSYLETELNGTSDHDRYVLSSLKHMRSLVDIKFHIVNYQANAQKVIIKELASALQDYSNMEKLKISFVTFSGTINVEKEVISTINHMKSKRFKKIAIFKNMNPFVNNKL